MKFWQYVVGGLLAILVFSAVLIADNIQFSERNSFSQNPFSLLGTSDISFGGEMQFFPSGEILWANEGVVLNLTDEKRELIQGTVVVAGTFYPTAEDMPVTNMLWFGNMRLYVPKTSALIHIDEEGMVTILSGGGSLELFFKEEETPFVIPAESRVTFEKDFRLDRDPNVSYYDLSMEFSLAPLGTGEYATRLWEVEQAVADWRSQFGHFAWDIPLLWETQHGVFLQFLEKITPVLPEQKAATRAFQEITIPLQQARAKVDERSTINILQNFKNTVLPSDKWESVLQQSDQAQKEWSWFERAQKIWLPIVSPDAHEQKFSILWRNEDVDPLLSRIQILNLLSHNERWLRAERQFEILTKEFSETEFSAGDLWRIVRIRREMGNLLRRFPLHQTIENFQLWTDMIRVEREYLASGNRMVLTEEEGHALLDFIAQFITQENDAGITQLLNQLWFDLNISVKQNSNFSSEERTTIQLIDLVGVSGMTPDQARKVQEQEQRREDIADQLDALLEIKEEPEEVVDMGISNAKKLWEFLASEHIDLDINSFRTTRTETELTTRFANTAEGKRKIEGVFDYNEQSFVMLTLGEETTSDMPAYRLGRWIKQIGGKFESDSLSQESVRQENEVLQTAPQAVLGRKLVQELLKSLGIDVSRDQITMKDETYQKALIQDATYGVVKVHAEYNLVTQMFSTISLEKEGVVVSHAGSVSVDNFVDTLGSLKTTLPDTRN